MSIVTKAELSTLVNRKLRTFSQTRESEVYKARRDFRYGKTTSIFLSHCNDDKEEIEIAVVFFRKLGIHIYVDWMDDAMPTITSDVTATRLKEKIKENEKFILLATNGAVSSKWCNWELGLGDAEKYLQDICLFPLADNNKNWEGNEYLNIYPRIEGEFYKSGEYIYSDEWFVIYPNNKRKVRLVDWLKY